jgi:hypothetical protein
VAKKLRQLVIDASVAASAGTTAHPESSACRNFLFILSEVGHTIVMTALIQTEWNLHSGKFATAWLAQMVSRRQVKWVSNCEINELRRSIERYSKNKAPVKVMREDVHLIEAALATTSAIASKDNEARATFAKASSTITLLRAVCWMNPVEAEDAGLHWLTNGAKPIRSLSLQTHRQRLGND